VPSDPRTPTALAVGARPNDAVPRAALVPAADLPAALGTFESRLITALTFTRDGALVAVAGGLDLNRPMAFMRRYVYRAFAVQLDADPPPGRTLTITDDVTQPFDVNVRALAPRGREVWLATAYGLRGYWRRGTGADAAYAPIALGRPGVDYPPYTQLGFAHAGRDRLLLSSFAWKRWKDERWVRWTGTRLEQYAGTGAVELAEDPWAPQRPRLRAPAEPRRPELRPRPYSPARDPGWRPVEGPPPPGLTLGVCLVTDAAESESRLWIGTNAGLTAYDEPAASYDTYGPERGLQTAAVTTLRASQGYLLVSTFDGIFLLPAA
jgi:hypothetical protein